MRFTKNLLALPFVLISFAASSSAQTGAEKKTDKNTGTIIGSVSGQGKPLPGATITLWHQGASEPGGSNVERLVSANDNGDYTLSDVPAGNYYISAGLPGYVTGKENQVFANLRAVNAVTNGKVERVDFDLVREGVIRGVVTDAEDKPLARIPITITTEIMPEGSVPKYARDLRTDEQGNYRIAGLPPGKYRVAAGHYPLTNATLFGRVGYRRTFYGDTTVESQAKVIEVTSGADIKVDINIGAPVRTFRVSATILDSLSGKPIDDMGYDVRVFENGKMVGGAGTRGRSNDKGEIVIENVPSGEFSIVVPHTSGVLPAQGELPSAPNIFGESKHFEVVDKDVSGIEIRVNRAATLSGFVTIEGAATVEIRARLSEIRVRSMMIMAPMTTASVNPDGAFTLTGLKPGKLQISFLCPCKEPLPLRFVRVERDGIRLDQDLDIQSGEQITGVRLVLGYTNSRIHGVVRLDNVPLANSAGRASAWQYGKPVSFGDLDSRGEFFLPSLSAGEYEVVVVVRDVNGKSPSVKKQVKIEDDSVAEVTMELSSAPPRSEARKPQ